MLDFTKAEMANHFDLALLSPNLVQTDIDQGVKDAAEYGVRSLNVQPCWVKYANQKLAELDTKVRASAVAGFPQGANTTVQKMREVNEMIEAGASAIDMVTNIGKVIDGDWEYIAKETNEFGRLCREAGIVSKLILEVGYLNLDQIGRLTKVICDAGLTYAKTATGTQAFPDIPQVMKMQESLSGDTKIKVSGVPRTFALPAVLFLFEHFKCDLVGTRSACKITQQYLDLKETLKL